MPPIEQFRALEFLFCLPTYFVMAVIAVGVVRNNFYSLLHLEETVVGRKLGERNCSVPCLPQRENTRCPCLSLLAGGHVFALGAPTEMMKGLCIFLSFAR